MSFTENLYLKRQLQQLQEENLKLKKILTEISDQEADSLMASHLGLHSRVSTEPSLEKFARMGVLIDEIPRDIDPKTGEYVPVPPPQGMMPPRPGPSPIPDTALTSRSFTEKIRGSEPQKGVFKGPATIDSDEPQKGVFKGPPPFDPNKPKETKIGENLRRAKYTNPKLRNENNQNYETPAAFGYSASGAVNRVLRGGKPLEKMTPEEAFQHGQDHSMLQGVSTPAHYFENPHFAAGFNSTK